MIRLQDKTPEVYCAESRDFQLFCRLYDCVMNGVKFDIDTIPDILDATKCRTAVLSLLQTKLGFFTNKQVTDDALRYVLTAFPIMVKNKGSLKAIQQAVNVFFKINGLRNAVKVWTVSEASKVYDTWVNDHTIIIGINSTVKDISLLEELFKYIMPTGFDYYFYFYNETTGIDPYYLQDKAVLLFTSDDLNSEIRSDVTIIDGEESKNKLNIVSDNEELNQLWSAVDTMAVNSHDGMLYTANGTYNAGDDNKFRGLFNDVSDLPTTALVNDIAMVYNQQYVYFEGEEKWQPIRFRGIVPSLEYLSNVENHDVVALGTRYAYYRPYMGKLVVLKYRGVYNAVEEVPEPMKDDTVKVGDVYKVYTGSTWITISYINLYYKMPKYTDVASDTIALLKSYDYYMYDSETKKWNKTPLVIYMLDVDKIGG